MTASAIRRVLITGGHGFVGARLVRALAARHPEWRVDAPPGPGEDGGLDVLDAAAVGRRVADGEPDVVVHLAAVAAVTSATRDPRQAWDVNLGGTLNLVLALQAARPRARLLHVSSAEVYGASLADHDPAGEATPLAPVNPYAASKAAADLLVGQAARSGLASLVARPFNHIGAGQAEAFVASSFAAQIARIEAGLQPPVLSVGSLDEERDFLDVADVVDAYVRLIEADLFGAPAVFNVASGRPVRIGALLDGLLSLSTTAIEVRQEPSRLRATPIPRVVGDARALQAATGWRPTIPLADTLAAILAEKRAALAAR